MSEPTSTEYPEEGQPVTTPEPAIEAMEAVEEAAVEAEALDLADAADEYEAEVGNAAEIPVVYTERPVQTVGRRKEAVVRVRLMPGTGKFTRLLVPTGADLLAVEPVAGMREQFSSVLPDVEIVSGTADELPVEDDSFDVVTVAQAFHWFDLPVACAEIHEACRQPVLKGWLPVTR